MNSPMRANKRERRVSAPAISGPVKRDPRSISSTTVDFVCARCSAESAPSCRKNESARRVLKESSAPVKSGSASSVMQPSFSNCARCRLTTSVTRRSNGKPARFAHQAMRRLLQSRLKDLEKRSGASWMDSGARASGPAMAERSSATSSTVRAMGPTTLRGLQALSEGTFGTLPADGRKPTTEQKAAGLRRDPPKSLPSAMGTRPQASATAAPPLLPPQVLLKSQGFRVAPKTGLNVWEPAPNSGVLVLPIVMAPAACARWTSSVLKSGT